MSLSAPGMGSVSEEERSSKLLSEVLLGQTAISACIAALEVVQSVLHQGVEVPQDLVGSVILLLDSARINRRQRIITDSRVCAVVAECQAAANYQSIFYEEGAAKAQLVPLSEGEEYQVLTEGLTPLLLDVHKAAEGVLQSVLPPGSQPVQAPLQDGAAADQTVQAGGETLDSTSSTPGGAQGPLLSTVLGDSSAPPPSAPVPDSQAHYHTGDGSTLDLLAGMSLGTTSPMFPAPPPTSSPSHPVSVGQVVLPTTSSSGTSSQAPSSLLGPLVSQLPHGAHPDHSQTSLGLSSLYVDLHSQGPFFGAPLGTPLPSEAGTQGAPLRGPFHGHAIGMPLPSETETPTQWTPHLGPFSGPASVLPPPTTTAASAPTPLEGAVGSSPSGESPTDATGDSPQDDGHQSAQ
ncbi:hypothetical protein cyc_07799 [Cyclospora cayetanensis]|uniref:Uncharacterized protein n=1 Tax=Cyclospora cayetanensis TaxID=88456 RepID=A0A1D3CSJ6_9EIME|nr:hypothetical protein cyc_07799 [Cyclospora cayetanensis]